MFEGFPKELPDFLWGLALHNEKPWFEAHRAQYERCLHEPFKAFATEAQAAFEARWPDRAPALHVSRINRDARRLCGLGPYKDHMWFSLGETAELYAEAPKFWFEIGPKSYGCGMGYFMAGPDVMERWRAAADANPARLERLVKAFDRQTLFKRYGECYKRPKGDPGPLLYDWYNAKDIGFEREVLFDPDPPGPELVDELMGALAVLMPLYEYMRKL